MDDDENILVHIVGGKRIQKFTSDGKFKLITLDNVGLDGPRGIKALCGR